jgi:predicted enzyme related to lactoylglutathione lyase
MSQNITLIVYPASDLDSAVAFYTDYLGIDPYVESEYYAGFKNENLEIGLDPRSKEIISYIEVTDIQESLDELLEAGASIHQPIKNVGEGMSVVLVKDPNGNIVGLRQLGND